MYTTKLISWHGSNSAIHGLLTLFKRSWAEPLGLNKQTNTNQTHKQTRRKIAMKARGDGGNTRKDAHKSKAEKEW